MRKILLSIIILSIIFLNGCSFEDCMEKCEYDNQNDSIYKSNFEHIENKLNISHNSRVYHYCLYNCS